MKSPPCKIKQIYDTTVRKKNIMVYLISKTNALNMHWNCLSEIIVKRNLKIDYIFSEFITILENWKILIFHL